jgi:quercetin dioxygenase-like cupin family protein
MKLRLDLRDVYKGDCVTADGSTVDLHPGGLVHLAARLPHAVEAVEASRLQLTMLDPRGPA